jgi:hypothetical protein
MFLVFFDWIVQTGLNTSLHSIIDLYGRGVRTGCADGCADGFETRPYRLNAALVKICAGIS